MEGKVRFCKEKVVWIVRKEQWIKESLLVNLTNENIKGGWP